MIFRDEGDEDLRKVDPGHEEGKGDHHQEQENLVVAKASNVREEIIEIKIFLWCVFFWISSFQTLLSFKVWSDFVRHVTLVGVPNQGGYQYLCFNTLIHSKPTRIEYFPGPSSGRFVEARRLSPEVASLTRKYRITKLPDHQRANT